LKDLGDTVATSEKIGCDRMPVLPAGQTIESVRRNLNDERAERVLGFWSQHGVLEGEAARGRLDDVVCLLRNEADEIIGVNSVYEEALALIGGRRLWIYRSYLLPDASSADAAMVNATFDLLEQEFGSNRLGPIGLCVPSTDAEQAQRGREVVLPETKLMYVGYLDAGRQARIRYFDDAPIGPGLPTSPTLAETALGDYPLEDRYRIEPLAETDAVSVDDVLELWAREGAVAEDDAPRRVHEVILVAIDRDDSLAGISSAYLQRNDQLRMDLWYYRTYVAKPHRQSNIATQMLWASRDYLKNRFVSGEDIRAGGMIFELENQGLKDYFNRALWLPANFTFIGENDRGDHVRVHYFPGAVAPS
jgi:hypothetical protein